MVVKLLIRLVINAAALAAAVYFIDDIHFVGSTFGLITVALIFGVINAFIKPLAKWLSLPLMVLTLGLFTLVINTLMLLLTAGLTDKLVIDGFWPALWGSLVISAVSWVLGLFLDD